MSSFSFTRQLHLHVGRLCCLGLAAWLVCSWSPISQGQPKDQSQDQIEDQNQDQNPTTSQATPANDLTPVSPGDAIKRPEKPTPIMPLADVKVGMRGYGLTVFSGTQIEPFAVHVVAVVPGNPASKSTFWIICDDPRLELSGPVQGMSGSPIYLWPNSEDDSFDPSTQNLGEDGLLAGAFAFGYGGVRVCLAGVQPIEQMRGVGGRASETPDTSLASQSVAPTLAAQIMANTALAAEQAQNPAAARLAYWLHLAATGQALPNSKDNNAYANWLKATSGTIVSNDSTSVFNQSSRIQEPTQRFSHSNQNIRIPQAKRLSIPMAVANPELAQFFAPIFAPMGIQPVAGNNFNSNSNTLLNQGPHASIDISQAMLEPGSPLVVPYAWGDADLSGNGTVTDVLPDGTVLAFGHAMDGIGDTAMPMATGYVHFMVPTREISFRQAAPLSFQGTITRDEQSAIAGKPVALFDAAPVTITVDLPGQPQRVFNYHVINHPLITPPICAILAGQSVAAFQDIPPISTVQLQYTATFSNGRSISQQVSLPLADTRAISSSVLPVLNALLTNSFQPLGLASFDAHITVETGSQGLQLAEAWLNTPQVRPGETIEVTGKFVRFRGQTQTINLSIQVPDNMPPGEHQVLLTDSDGYMNQTLRTRPDILQTMDLDQLFEAAEMILGTQSNRLYLMLQTPGGALAFADRYMPDLPSSRMAILGAVGPGTVTAVPRLTSQFIEVDGIPGGVQMALPVVVLPKHHEP